MGKLSLFKLQIRAEQPVLYNICTRYAHSQEWQDIRLSKPVRLVFYYSQLLNAFKFHAAEIFLSEPKEWEGKSCVDLFYCEYSKEGMVKLQKTTAKKPVGLFI